MVDFAPPLALARAELRGASRKARWFVMRVALCGVLASLLFSAYYPIWESSNELISPTALAPMAHYFFSLFAAGALAAVALVLPGLMATSVAGERDRRTLDDLLVSPLTNNQIVFGKAVARVVEAGSLLLAGFGMLAIASLLGGSDLGALLRLSAVALSTAWAVTGWSMAVSVSSPRTRDSLVRIYGWLILVWGLPPLLMSPILQWLLPLSAMPEWLADSVMFAFAVLLCLNPFVIYFGSSWLPQPDLAYLAMFALHGVIGAVGLGWAIWRLRKPTALTGARRTVRDWWTQPLRKRSVGRWPMLWKESSRATRGSTILSALLVLGVALFLIWYGRYCLLNTPNWREAFLPGVFAIAIILCCATLVLVACRAATAVSVERERDTWISLLSSPLPAREIMSAKLLGAIYAFRWLLGLIIVLGALSFLVRPDAAWAILLTGLVMIVLVTAAAALGLTVSRRSPSTGRALMITIALGFTVGGGYLLLCLPLMYVAGSDPPELVMCGVLPFLLLMPGICFTEGSPPPGIVRAFVLGVVCYALASMILISVHRREIDRIDDSEAPFPRPRRLPAPETAT